jgi:hypothetical protein
LQKKIFVRLVGFLATLLIALPGSSLAAEVEAPLSSDNSLSVLQVNGTSYSPGSQVYLPEGTESVDVNAVPTDPNADVTLVEGDVDLAPGENDLLVEVTAENAVAKTYRLTLYVEYSGDVSLFEFTVDGVDVVDGQTIDLASGTESVDVFATPNDPDASVVEVVGDQDLVDGESTLSVTVLAADGETSKTYTVQLNVLPSNNTDLFEFTVDGEDVLDQSSLTLPAGTDEVEVFVTPTDENAVVVSVDGETSLVEGDNVVTVVVLAADGITSKTYTVTLVVPGSSDAELFEFTVDGVDVINNQVVDLPYGTESVEVFATPSDPDALVDWSGDFDLVVGDNNLLVTVTPVVGEAVVYKVTLRVAKASSDTEISAITVDGKAAAIGGTVSMPQGTTDIDVFVTLRNEFAEYSVEGDFDLKAGNNTVTVRVTAQDGTVKAYTFIANVLNPSKDTTLKLLQVDGRTVAPGSTVLLLAGTKSVQAVGVPNDAKATGRVQSGDTNLTAGDNTLVVRITAEDTAVFADYRVTLRVVTSNDQIFKPVTSPVIAAGKGFATVAGVSSNTTVTTSSPNVSVQGTNFGSLFTAFGLDGKTIALSTLKQQTIQIGGAISISASGFGSNLPVSVYAYSGTKSFLLGSIVAGPSGAVNGKLGIPTGVAVGDARILVSGFAANKSDVLSIGLGVKVKAGFTTLTIAVKAIPLTGKIPAAGTKALAVISTKVKTFTYVKVTLQISQSTSASVAAKATTAVKTAVAGLLNKLKPKPVQVFVVLAPKKLVKTAKSGDVVATIQFTK